MNKLTFNNNNKKDFLRRHAALWPVVFSLEGRKEVRGRKRDKMEEEIRRKYIQAKDLTKKKNYFLKSKGELKK